MFLNNNYKKRVIDYKLLSNYLNITNRQDICGLNQTISSDIVNLINNKLQYGQTHVNSENLHHIVPRGIIVDNIILIITGSVIASLLIGIFTISTRKYGILNMLKVIGYIVLII